MSELPAAAEAAKQPLARSADLRWRARALDWLIALGLLVGFVALLLSTARDLGYARDEGFYFQASKSYAQWFELFFRDPKGAMAQPVVDRYWRANNEHPAFIKSLFALSYQFLFTKWKLFAEQGTAFRFPAMLLSGAALSVTYLWARRLFGTSAVGRLSALVSAVLLGATPRIFYHSHLACFDMPVLAMWLITTYAYWRTSQNNRWGSAILSGVLYGLLLNTKHNSWLLPFALAPHLLLIGGLRFWRRPLAGRRGALKALLCMATLGPLVFYAAWPWIWRDTFARLTAYARFHLHHDYYNMEFLGHTYWEPPMPRGYAPLLTLATVPTITLTLFALGLLIAFRAPLLGLIAALVRRARRAAEAAPAQPQPHFATFALWGLCVLISYAPWLRTDTPIFGGTKHWIQAYPFICLFAGVGVSVTLRRLAELVRGAPLRDAAKRWLAPGVQGAGAACIVCAPIVMTLHSHPWGLSAYVPLVGGAPGAATLGLNRTFWGYTTGSAADFINREAPKGARIFIHDTAGQSWQMMVSDGRLRRDLRIAWRPSDSDIAIYHHEPHMLKVEYQVWVAYGTTQPAWVGAHDGVPVIWIYQRPKPRGQQP